jgi:hypothetical protein
MRRSPQVHALCTLLVVMAGLVVALACDPIPQLTFADPADGASDGTTGGTAEGATTGTTGTSGDGSVTDGSDAADDGGDGAAENTCPAAVPNGAEACCEAVVCVHRQAARRCSAVCSECVTRCTGEGLPVCCLRGNGNVEQCAATIADCP